MDYNEFIEKLKQQAHEELGYPLEGMNFYPEGYTTDDPQQQEWVMDTNRRFLGVESTTLQSDFMTMDVPQSGNLIQQQRMSLRSLYNEAQKKGFDAAFQHIRDMQKNVVNAVVDKNKLHARSNFDYERIEDQLILRPLNYNRHFNDLKGCVYRKINDFVLCLYQVLSDDGKNLLSSKIKKDELALWRIDEDEVMRSALENTARLYPAVIYDQRTMQEELFMEKEFTKADITMRTSTGNIIMLSTSKATNGAVALFYPGVMKKMMKIMGGPFQAVFMNTNDILIFDRHDRMAVEYARTAREDSIMGEMLSKRVYLCDGNQIIPGIIVKIDPNND